MSIREVLRLGKWVPRCITYFSHGGDQTADKRHLKGGRTYFDSHFEGTQSMPVRQAEQKWLHGGGSVRLLAHIPGLIRKPRKEW